jgi:hypothetical protein
MRVMRRPLDTPCLLAALRTFASVLAVGCGGSASGSPDAAVASGNDARAAMGTATAGDAGDALFKDAGDGVTGVLGYDSGDDDAATPISWDGRAPLDHRVSATACSQGRDGGFGLSCPDSGAGPLPGNPCAVDTDCTGGSDGVCLCAPDLVPPASGTGLGMIYTQTFCSYDECFVDGDCGSRIPCECRDQNIFGAPNVCLAASNCAVDSDCGPPGFCSPSVVVGQSPSVAFFCHTPSDTCSEDSDCPVPDGPFVEQCRFDAPTAIWRCFMLPTRP